MPRPNHLAAGFQKEVLPRALSLLQIGALIGVYTKTEAEINSMVEHDHRRVENKCTCSGMHGP